MTDLAVFDDLCPYWEFFEHGGLNKNVLLFKKYIKNPVLLLGSGQGLVSEKLLINGFDITNVDRSESMIYYAKRRRNIETIQADATKFCFDRKFSTIIISTGLITNTAFEARFLSNLVENADNHLIHGGYVIMAYFKRSAVIDAFTRLGLLDLSSNNSFFWDGREALDNVRARFIREGYNKLLIDDIFSRYEEEIDRHRLLIMSIGNKYIDIHMTEPPPQFFDMYASLSSLYLTNKDERSLIMIIEEKHKILEEFETTNNTKILIYAKK